LSQSTSGTSRTPPPLLLLRLTSLAVATPLVMRAGLPRVQQWLEPRRSPTVDDLDVDLVVAQYGRWVDAVIRRGQPIVKRGCLTRGVTLYGGLRHAGVPVGLCFGMGLVDGAMGGHCWIELDDRPLLEPTDPHAMFTEVARVSKDGVTDGAGVRGGLGEWKPHTV
jgi:hypothetical protein